MSLVQRSLSNTFQRFVDSEKSGGILLLACTAVSLVIANSSIGADYLGWWQAPAGGLSIEHWINDAPATRGSGGWRPRTQVPAGTGLDRG